MAIGESKERLLLPMQGLSLTCEEWSAGKQAREIVMALAPELFRDLAVFQRLWTKRSVLGAKRQVLLPENAIGRWIISHLGEAPVHPC